MRVGVMRMWCETVCSDVMGVTGRGVCVRGCIVCAVG